jgi:nitrite reductase/ring-hydroxylating ferredoxin subunit
MSQWVKVCAPDDLNNNDKLCTTIDGIPIVVCKVDDQLTAFQNSCPHAHLPLGDGDLTGATLICPYHGYAYNTITGKNIDFEDEVPLAMMPVRTEDDNIEIQLPCEVDAPGE